MSPILRRHGTTIALVALTAAAGAVVFGVDRGSVSTHEKIARRKNLLEAFRDDDVSEVKVTARGSAARLFRGPVDAVGQRPWQVEIDGRTFAAEEPVVDQYLAALRDGVVDRWLTGSTEGTGEATAMIAVEMGRRRYVVTLRGPAPTPPGSIYAEVQGGDAPVTGVVSAQLAAVLAASLDSFRQKALVSWGPADVTAISIDGEGGARHLVRGAFPAPRGASFRFDGSTPEGPVRAAAPALDRVWEAIGKLSAEAFLADAEADRALDHKLTLGLTGPGGEKVTLDLGGACPGHPDDVVAVRRGPRGDRLSACVPRGALTMLAIPAADLTDRRVIGARAEEVIDLKLASGPTTIALARSGSQWHEQTPTDRPVDTDVGKAFLDRLLAVSASRIAGFDRDHLGALGLDPPRATVRVVSLVPAAGADGGDVERTEIIEIGAERDGVVPVRRAEDGAVVEVPAEQAAALLPDEITLRPRKVYDAAFASVRAVRVTSPGRTQRFERGADGSWSLIEPKGAGLLPDMSALTELGDAVCGLKVDRWVGPARPDHGLDHPRLVVELDLGGDAGAGKERRPLTVALGAPAGSGGSFARAGDDPTVFVVSRRIEDTADRWMIDRTTLVTEVSRVTHVTLTAPGGKRVTLEASGGAFHVAGAAADPAANARAAAVRDALADLVAEGTTSVGRPDPGEGFDHPALEISLEVAGKPVKIRFGAGDTRKGTRVFYARREGVDATFAVAQARVRPLLDAAGVRE